METDKKLKAVVVGAGISGLQVGTLLLEKGFEVTILEAKDYVGGRIKENLTLADFPVELGAEEVHGGDSLHAKIAKKAGGELVNMSELSYYVEYQGKVYEQGELAQKNEWFARILQLDWEELCAYDSNKEDVKLSDYVKDNGFPSDLNHAIQAIFASEWATDLETLSVKGIQKWNVEWDFGEENFILKNMSNTQLLKSEYGRVFNLFSPTYAKMYTKRNLFFCQIPSEISILSINFYSNGIERYMQVVALYLISLSLHLGGKEGV